MVVAQEHVPHGLSDDSSDRGRGTAWRSLYRVGGVAATLAAVITPLTIAVFAKWPPPYDAGAAEWFELLHGNPILGLVSLDLLFVIVSILMLPVMLALYVALRRVSPAYMTLAIVVIFVGLAAFLATNPSIEMLSLSNRYANATTAAERLALLGAGQALLAGFEGTAFHVNYIFAQLAGIVIGFVILRSDVFSRPMGLCMIAGNAVGFGLYLPVVGLGLSAFSGVILWVWLIFVARDLFHLSRPVYGTSLLDVGQ
jgi:hypothetical protein